MKKPKTGVVNVVNVVGAVSSTNLNPTNAKHFVEPKNPMKTNKPKKNVDKSKSSKSAKFFRFVARKKKRSVASSGAEAPSSSINPKPKFNSDKFEYKDSWLDHLEHPGRLHFEDCGNVVYIIARTDFTQKKLYIGETQNIKIRWDQHNCIGASEAGAMVTREWVAEGFQAEPVCVIRGFKSLHDSLGFETLIQSLKFKQFKKSVENHWKYKKNLLNKTLHKEIRRLLVALRTNRWKNYPLQICWFHLGFRPNAVDLGLSPHQSECLMPNFETVTSLHLSNISNINIPHHLYSFTRKLDVDTVDTLNNQTDNQDNQCISDSE